MALSRDFLLFTGSTELTIAVVVKRAVCFSAVLPARKAIMGVSLVLIKIRVKKPPTWKLIRVGKASSNYISDINHNTKLYKYFINRKYSDNKQVVIGQGIILIFSRVMKTF